MEMCYDGALVMPSSYAVMDEEEMTYVEGGKITKAYCKGVVVGVVTTLVAAIAKSAVKQSMVGAAINAAGAWVAGVIDTAIIALYCHPLAGTAIIIGGLAAITGTVYVIGKKKKYWK